MGKFLGAEEEVKEAVNKKKNSPFAAIAGGEQGDWEEFQALEDLRRKRLELESYCRLYAPPGTWDRWQQWQAEARKERQAARKAAEKAREERMEALGIASGGVMAVIVIVTAVYYLGVYMEKW